MVTDKIKNPFDDKEFDNMGNVDWTPAPPLPAYSLKIPDTATLKDIINVINTLGLQFRGNENDKQFKALEKYLVKE